MIPVLAASPARRAKGVFVQSLVAGTIAAAVESDDEITITQTVAPAGGQAPITVAIYRHTSTFTPPGTGTLIGTSFPCSATGLNPETQYFFEAVYTDGLSSTANSNEVNATTEAGGGQEVLLEVRWLTGIGDIGSVSEATLTNYVTDADNDTPANTPEGFHCQNAWENVLSVVDPEDVDYPYTSNVLSIRAAGTGSGLNGGCGHCRWETLFPMPEAGAFWAWTYDVMNDVNNNTIDQHPFCLWPVGNIELVFQQFGDMTAGGDFRPIISPTDNTDDFNGGAGNPYLAPKSNSTTNIFLTAGVWYRMQFIMAWETEDTYRILPRISRLPADGGAIVADIDDWYQYENFGENMLSWYNQDSSHRFGERTDIANMRTISFGKGQDQGTQTGLWYRVAGLRVGIVEAEDDYLDGITD